MERFERILQYCQVKYCHTEVFFFFSFWSLVILNESYCEISSIILPTSNPYVLFAQQKKSCNAKLIFLIYLPPFSLNPALISVSARSIHMALSIHPCVNWAFILYLPDRGCIVCDGHSDLKKHLSATYLCGVELLSCISEWDSTFIGGYEENYNVSGTTGPLLPPAGHEYK